MKNCVLDPNQAWEILYNMYKRGESVRSLGEKLGVSKSSIHRILKRVQTPSTIIRIKLCEMIPEDELVNILKGSQLLKSYGLVDRDGRLNKPVILAIIDAVMQDARFKEDVLRYLLKYYKKEITQQLSETLPKIELIWSANFEYYLTRKKSKPLSERTLRDYKNIWSLCLEGKELGWHLLRQLEGNKMLCRDGDYHPTGWVRQVFRHYVRYLYSTGRLDWDTYSRLLLAVPGRRYGRKILQKPINIEDVRKTLLVLKEERLDIYTLYLFILFSATRFEHSLRIFRGWSPDEVVYVPYLARNVKRLECLSDGFCRYYAGSENERKPIGFAYFPRSLLNYIVRYKDKLPSRRRIEKIVERHNGLMPKYIRIFALREMKRVFDDTDTYKFIVSKFGELTVSARHYMDLLSEADTIYPSYVNYIREVFGDAIQAE